jgi:hypothetical protein
MDACLSSSFGEILRHLRQLLTFAAGIHPNGQETPEHCLMLDSHPVECLGNFAH